VLGLWYGSAFSHWERFSISMRWPISTSTSPRLLRESVSLDDFISTRIVPRPTWTS
jgi:hypothetical protein